ncbi:MAG: enolase C-terminal domain-like protein [Pseudomonadota bacterium]
MADPWRIEASVHRPGADPGDPAPYAGADSFTFVRLKLRDPDGVAGEGYTGRFLAPEVAHFLNHAVAEAMAQSGADPVADMSARFNPRGMTGVVVSALSALDIALTDIRAKRAGQSVAHYLGGCRSTAPVHVTCGFPALDREDLVRACAREVEAGAAGVKVLIAARGRSVAQDIKRLRAVRAAIGPAADLIADANCKMTARDAADFARHAADLALACLEEPVVGNDRHALGQLVQGGARLGAGQMEQSAERFDLLTDAGVQVIQPNAVFAGGFAAAIAAARRAQASGAEVSPGGGWDIVNLHWMCGAMATGAVELHRAQARIARLLTGDAPRLRDGHLHLPDGPGLGLVPDEWALSACRIG